MEKSDIKRVLKMNKRAVNDVECHIIEADFDHVSNEILKLVSKNECISHVNDCITKPPLGIIPKNIWIDIRRSELLEAIGRYAGAKKEIPQDWVDEINGYSR